jgi:hypothetical protein
VGTGSREENALQQEAKANSVLLRTELALANQAAAVTRPFPAPWLAVMACCNGLL